MRHFTEPARDALRLTTVLHALSDPTRLAIVHTLVDHERHCSEFDTNLSKPSLSHHFRVLRDSGITHTRRSGRWNFISLRRDDLDALFPGLLDAVLTGSDTALEDAGVVIKEAGPEAGRAAVSGQPKATVA